MSVAAAFQTPNSFLTGIRALLPLWLYLALGILALMTGHSPAPAQTALALMMLTPPLWFASLAWPHLTPALVARTLLVATGAVAAVGLAQYLGWADGWFPRVETYTQPMYSVFGNQDLLGGFMALGLVIAVQQIFGERSPAASRALAIGAAALLLPAWMLAGSRTAWLAGALGIVLAVWLSRPIGSIRYGRPILPLALIGAVAAMALVALAPAETIGRVTNTFGADDEGGWLRLWFWDATLRMVREAPLAGVGLGAFSHEAPRFLGAAYMDASWITHRYTELTVDHAHSDLLEALAETGIVGAILLGWMGIRLVRARPEGSQGRPHPSAWPPLLTLGVFACFNTPVMSPPHAVAGLMLMACLMTGHVRDTQRSAPAIRPKLLTTGVPVGFSALLLAVVIAFLLVPSVSLRSAQTAHLAGSDTLPDYNLAAASWSPFAAEAWASQAQCHVEHEQWDAAIAAYERALTGMDTGRVHLELGALHYRTGRIDLATPRLAAAVQRWPWNYDAWRIYLAVSPLSAHTDKLQAVLPRLPAETRERLKALIPPSP